MPRQGDRAATAQFDPRFKLLSSTRTTPQVDRVTYTKAFADFARLDAMKRPSKRSPPSFWIWIWHLWALQVYRLKVPASSSEIEAYPKFDQV
jgi:hypothetical protein